MPIFKKVEKDTHVIPSLGTRSRKIAIDSYYPGLHIKSQANFVHWNANFEDSWNLLPFEIAYFILRQFS